VVTSILIGTGILLLVSVVASKAARIGVPALLIFLCIGMLAGSDGPGGIQFDNPPLAQGLGIAALALILFSGGLDTRWEDVRPVLGAGLKLATLGTLITAAATGAFAAVVLDLPWMRGLLIGAIVCSTDAAAVFGVLRSRGVRLAPRLRSLLELESGSNDPMAVFLTIGIVQLLLEPETSPLWLIWLFVRQMSIGAVAGYLMGRVGSLSVNRLRLEYDGLYPVLTLSIVLITFGLTDWMGGSGFLAVYLAGIEMRRADFLHKRSLIRFHDGVSWLMQITMFTVLGLQVFPSTLRFIAWPALAIALFLMLVGRPVAVIAMMLGSDFSGRARALVAWVGLRGAAPIILATFPLVYGIPGSSQIFDVVFFIVLTSAAIQGTTVSWVGRKLGLAAATGGQAMDLLEEVATGGREMLDLTVAPGSQAAGRRVMDLQLPSGALVVLVERNGRSWIPTGASELLAEDRLLVLSGQAERETVRRRLEEALPRE
jgi:cell volume regulation protein A